MPALEPDPVRAMEVNERLQHGAEASSDRADELLGGQGSGGLEDLAVGPAAVGEERLDRFGCASHGGPPRWAGSALRQDLFVPLAAVGRVAARVAARIERDGLVADRALQPAVAGNRREAGRAARGADPPREAALVAFVLHQPEWYAARVLSAPALGRQAPGGFDRRGHARLLANRLDLRAGVLESRRIAARY